MGIVLIKIFIGFVLGSIITSIIIYFSKNKQKKRRKSFALKRFINGGLLNTESFESKWEMTHFKEDGKIQIHYVPEDDYSDNDIKIMLTYDEFNDLAFLFERLNKIQKQRKKILKNRAKM